MISLNALYPTESGSTAFAKEENAVSFQYFCSKYAISELEASPFTILIMILVSLSNVTYSLVSVIFHLFFINQISGEKTYNKMSEVCSANSFQVLFLTTPTPFHKATFILSHVFSGTLLMPQ
jgi:hypothetical protein